MEPMHKSEVHIGHELRAPKMYAVIMYNDDFTTMEFVVDVLIRVFRKSAQEANSIMLSVHENGSAAVGVYTYDVAMTKKNQTELIASEKGFPLKINVCEAAE